MIIRFVARVLQACVLFALDVIELIWGLGDLPDARPAIPDFVDYEYFDLLDHEGQR
jgi:hypothetical protein